MNSGISQQNIAQVQEEIARNISQVKNRLNEWLVRPQSGGIDVLADPIQEMSGALLIIGKTDAATLASYIWQVIEVLKNHVDDYAQGKTDFFDDVGENVAISLLILEDYVNHLGNVSKVETDNVASANAGLLEVIENKGGAAGLNLAQSPQIYANTYAALAEEIRQLSSEMRSRIEQAIERKKGLNAELLIEENNRLIGIFDLLNLAAPKILLSHVNELFASASSETDWINLAEAIILVEESLKDINIEENNSVQTLIEARNLQIRHSRLLKVKELCSLAATEAWGYFERLRKDMLNEEKLPSAQILLKAAQRLSYYASINALMNNAAIAKALHQFGAGLTEISQDNAPDNGALYPLVIEALVGVESIFHTQMQVSAVSDGYIAFLKKSAESLLAIKPIGAKAASIYKSFALADVNYEEEKQELSGDFAKALSDDLDALEYSYDPFATEGDEPEEEEAVEDEAVNVTAIINPSASFNKSSGGLSLSYTAQDSNAGATLAVTSADSAALIQAPAAGQAPVATPVAQETVLQGQAPVASAAASETAPIAQVGSVATAAVSAQEKTAHVADTQPIESASVASASAHAQTAVSSQADSASSLAEQVATSVTELETDVAQSALVADSSISAAVSDEVQVIDTAAKSSAAPTSFVSYFADKTSVESLNDLTVPSSKQSFLQPNADAVVDEEIREFFVEEFNEIVDNLKEIRSDWLKGHNAEESAKELRRAFHTLKGSGRTVGYESLAECAWQHERLLNQVMEGVIPANLLVRETITDGIDLFLLLRKQAEFKEHPAALLSQAAAVEAVLAALLEDSSLGDSPASFYQASAAHRLAASSQSIASQTAETAGQIQLDAQGQVDEASVAVGLGVASTDDATDLASLADLSAELSVADSGAEAVAGVGVSAADVNAQNEADALGFAMQSEANQSASVAFADAAITTTSADSDSGLALETNAASVATAPSEIGVVENRAQVESADIAVAVNKTQEEARETLGAVSQSIDFATETDATQAETLAHSVTDTVTDASGAFEIGFADSEEASTDVGAVAASTTESAHTATTASQAEHAAMVAKADDAVSVAELHSASVEGQATTDAKDSAIALSQQEFAAQLTAALRGEKGAQLAATLQTVLAETQTADSQADFVAAVSKQLANAPLTAQQTELARQALAGQANQQLAQEIVSAMTSGVPVGDAQELDAAFALQQTTEAQLASVISQQESEFVDVVGEAHVATPVEAVVQLDDEPMQLASESEEVVEQGAISAALAARIQKAIARGAVDGDEASLNAVAGAVASMLSKAGVASDSAEVAAELNDLLEPEMAEALFKRLSETTQVVDEARLLAKMQATLQRAARVTPVDNETMQALAFTLLRQWGGDVDDAAALAEFAANLTEGSPLDKDSSDRLVDALFQQAAVLSAENLAALDAKDKSKLAATSSVGASTDETVQTVEGLGLSLQVGDDAAADDDEATDSAIAASTQFSAKAQQTDKTDKVSSDAMFAVGADAHSGAAEDVAEQADVELAASLEFDAKAQTEEVGQDSALVGAQADAFVAEGETDAAGASIAQFSEAEKNAEQLVAAQADEQASAYQSVALSGAAVGQLNGDMLAQAEVLDALKDKAVAETSSFASEMVEADAEEAVNVSPIMTSAMRGASTVQDTALSGELMPRSSAFAGQSANSVRANNRSARSSAAADRLRSELQSIAQHPALSASNEPSSDEEKEALGQAAFYHAVDKFEYLSVNNDVYVNVDAIDELLDSIYDIEGNIQDNAPDWVWRMLEALEQLVLVHRYQNKLIAEVARDVLKESAHLLEHFNEGFDEEVVERNINSLLDLRRNSILVDELEEGGQPKQSETRKQAADKARQAFSQMSSVQQTEISNQLQPLDETQRSLVEIFLDESTALLNRSQIEADKWDQDIRNLSYLDGIRRDMHTLKGSARILEFAAVGDLAHAVETFLDSIIDGYSQPTPHAVAILSGALWQALLMLDDVRDGYVPRVNPHILNHISEFLDLPLPYPNIKQSEYASDAQEIEASVEVDAQRGMDSGAQHKTASASDSSGAVSAAASAADASDSQADEIEEDSDSPVELVAAEKFDDSIDPLFVEIFADEAEQILSSTWQYLNADLSSAITIDELNRLLHTLKGGANMVGFKVMGETSHLMESVVIKIPSLSSYAIVNAKKLLLLGYDGLREMLDSILREEMPREPIALNQSLRHFASEGRFIPPEEFAGQQSENEAESAEETELPNEPAEVAQDSEQTAQESEQSSEASQETAQTDDFADVAQSELATDAVADAQASDEAQAEKAGADVSDVLDAPAARSAVSDEDIVADILKAKQSAQTVASSATDTAAIQAEAAAADAPETTAASQAVEHAQPATAPETTDAVDSSVEESEKARALAAEQAMKAAMAEAAEKAAEAAAAKAAEKAAQAVQAEQATTAQTALTAEQAISSQQGVQAQTADSAATALDSQSQVMNQAQTETVVQEQAIAQTEKVLEKAAEQSGEAKDAVNEQKQTLVKAEEKAATPETEAQTRIRNAGNEAETPTLTRVPERPEVKHFVRVDAALLDRMIAAVGEVSILQSRMQNILANTDFNLGELVRISTRVNEQMWRLNNETEAQILFRREQQSADLAHFDPLEMDRFSEIQQLSRQLAEAVDDLHNVQDTLSIESHRLQSVVEQQSVLNRSLQEDLLTTQLLRFDIHEARFQRLIRQTASTLGKKANFILEGGSFEVERRLYDDLLPALEHIMRNSVAHGIEKPTERRRLGKPEQGIVKVSIANISGEIVVRVVDDGAGIDYDAVREKARERGILDESRADDEAYIATLIFHAGISTAKELTQVSGRGVGMDVVNEMLQTRRGRFEISSLRGEGTEFALYLPPSISLAEVLLVEVAEQKYVVPMSSIAAVKYLPDVELQRVLDGNTVYLRHGDMDYQVYVLGQSFARGQYALNNEYANQPVILVDAGGEAIGFHVDRILNRMEILIKGVNRQVLNIPSISGAAILGDGSVVPVIELLDLSRRIALLQSSKVVEAPVEEVAPKRILVVDDSVTMRKVSTRLLERNHFEVATAKDGLDAIDVLADFTPDLIMLDIEMPRMDGFEFATYVRQNSVVPEVPIVMITSRTGDKHRERADAIGVNAYLGKPYREEVLMETLSGLLDIPAFDAAEETN